MFVMHLFSTLDMLKFLKNIKLFRTLLTYIMKLFLKFFSHVFPDARMHGCFCPCITLCVRFNDCCSDLRKTFCYMFSPCGKFSVLWIKNTYFNYFYSIHTKYIFQFCSIEYIFELLNGGGICVTTLFLWLSFQLYWIYRRSLA